MVTAAVLAFITAKLTIEPASSGVNQLCVSSQEPLDSTDILVVGFQLIPHLNADIPAATEPTALAIVIVLDAVAEVAFFQKIYALSDVSDISVRVFPVTSSSVQVNDTAAEPELITQ